MSIVRYDRQALIGTEYDLGLRVTFDTALFLPIHRLHLHEEPSALPMISHQPGGDGNQSQRAHALLATELIADHNLKW